MKSIIRFVSIISTGPMAGASVYFKREENRLKREQTYLNFLELCARKAGELYPGELHAEICSTTKNNGVQMSGILLKKQGEVIAPNFYLESYYREWSYGRMSIEEITRGMLDAYEEELEKNRKIADALQFEWEIFKQHVYVRLVGRKRNEVLLEEIPYDEYLDMAMVYHYVIEVSEDTRGVLVVTNDHLRLLGITKEELREAALINTRKNRKPVLTGMDEMLRRLGKKLGIPMQRESVQNCMYVLGNATGDYGAVSMLFSRELELFSNEIQSGFYILPSSVHEVILVPDTGTIPTEVFSDMVRSVNATQVEETEVLTDSVYYYDREIHIVRRIA